MYTLKPQNNKEIPPPKCYLLDFLPLLGLNKLSFLRILLESGLGVAKNAIWAFMVKVVFGVSLLLTLISVEEKTACMEKMDGKAISHPLPEELGWSDKAEESQNTLLRMV